MSSDLRVELRFKNAPLWRAVFLSHASVAAFCRDYRLGQGTVGSLLTLKRSPFNARTGELIYVARRLCEILGFSAAELFPLSLYTGLLPSVLATEIEPERLTSLSDGALKLLEDGEDWEAHLVADLDKQLLAGHMAKVLHTLTPREENVLRQLYFEDKSQKEIADDQGVSNTRVSQIEQKAMRKLRHPSRARALVEHLDP